MKVKLKKPYLFEGKEYTEIDLELDSLTGEDVESIFAQIETVAKQNPSAPIVSTSWKYYAARASKLPVEFFNKLPALDYLKLSGLTNTFLQESV